MEPEHTPLGKGETSINHQFFVFQPFVFGGVIRLQEIQCIRCIALSCHCIQQGCEAKAIHATQLGPERDHGQGRTKIQQISMIPRNDQQKRFTGKHCFNSCGDQFQLGFMYKYTHQNETFDPENLWRNQVRHLLFRADSKHHLFQFQNHLSKEMKLHLAHISPT